MEVQMRRGGATHLVQAAAVVVSYVVLMASAGVRAQLRVGFYDSSCPAAEIICFVGGCEASVLVDSTKGNTAEKDAGPNTSLRGFEVIDRIKARVEQACFGVVSCADILAFAARDSVALTGGNAYQVPAGRRDGGVSRAQDTGGNLPPPTPNVNQLTKIFASKGLNQKDLQCGASASPGQLVPMDAVTPNSFDEGFYKGIMSNRGLLASDQALLSDGNTAVQVVSYANDPATFQSDFAAAMVKMGYIGALTGSSGKIRANCRVV
ncbi:unnamed protein product [Triticum turgidum subsp. durum]|uniref:Plant heme peroxidase family profile domain-containing protein n=1 Tax=Triticum turgidum subsp. durum TaxID=4567 RepID=A0A9R0QYZ4_TRITD|nr:unnamed protein product [Triticum turgidum subsp. durum]